jgi:hypothetical protein
MIIVNYTKYLKGDINVQFIWENDKQFLSIRKRDFDIAVNTNEGFTTIEDDELKFTFDFEMFDEKVDTIDTFIQDTLYSCHYRINLFTRSDFIRKRTLTIWKTFVKNKKCNRLGLKMLKIFAPHLGNPRFVNFEI